MLHAIKYFFVRPSSVSNATTEWSPAVFFRERRLINGDYAAGVLMTRLIDGKSYYRAMTDEEEQDFREETSI